MLAALGAALQHRTPDELANRITRNWEHWRWRVTAGEPVRDATAVAIRLTRRSLHCPDVRCEEGHQLDLDARCKACAQIAEHSVTRGTSSEDDLVVSDGKPPRLPLRGVLRRASAARPGVDETPHSADARSAAAPTAAAAATKPATTVDGRQHGALRRMECDRGRLPR
jgi:hypothetical protein